MIKGIKYALNSSVGTKHFKPLDKMIDEAITLVPSEEKTLISWDEFRVDNKTEKRFTLNAVVNGGCYLSIAAPETDDWVYINIYINGEVVSFHSIYESKTFPFYFKKGDVIEIVFTAESVFDEYISSVKVKGEFKKRNGLVEVRQ